MNSTWRTPNNGDWSALIWIRDLSSPHLASSARLGTGNLPPEIRIALRLACSPLPATTPVTSDVSRALLRTLSQSPIRDLVSEVTHVEGLTWRRYQGHGRTSFAAVLSNGDDEQAPTAWARFNPPPLASVQMLGDPACADFVLAIEPRTRHGDIRPPADLHFWFRWLVRALSVPAAVRNLVTEELGLSSAPDPPDRVGVFFRTPRALTELVDIGDLSRVPGSHISQHFMAGAIADSGGQDTAATARGWIMQLCDRDLPLDGYEHILLTLGS
ncbi:hypothetical protein [Dactylosporangium sp. NPDC048998]|uniref:hypothetical protein n=1 Tax=Dactylosporangium sp. NPDC048998 TaxID=3363976 RepID=UPI00370FF3F3